VSVWRTPIRSNEVNTGSHLGCLAVFTLCLSSAAAVAQGPDQGAAPRAYSCEANAHCSISCLVDGEKIVQTGSPKTVTITKLARNNYLVELVEQSGHVLFAYLAGTKVVCTLEGVTRSSGQ
jgi:hypothetical protein